MAILRATHNRIAYWVLSKHQAGYNVEVPALTLPGRNGQSISGGTTVKSDIIRKGKMPKKVLKVTTHLRAIPDWLKINSSITIPLPLKSAKELAKKLLEVQEDIDIEIRFATGKETAVEISLEPKKEE